MKKVLSIILSLLMVVSCMTCLLTSPAGTASAASASVSVTGANLLADITAADFTHHHASPNASKFSDATVTVGEEEVAAIRVGGAAYQKVYFTKTLTAGVTYTFSYSIKGDVMTNDTKVLLKDNLNEPDSIGSTTGEYMVTKPTSPQDVTDGVDRTYDPFTPTVTGDYVFAIAFDNKTTDTNADYIYNLSLIPTTDVSAKVEGNGAASVAAGENNSLIFTATPYGDSSFLGWYDAQGTNVGSDLTYTYTGDLVANPVTAKFNGTNLAAASNVAANWTEDGPNAPKFADATESQFGGNSVTLSSIRWQGVYLPLGFALEAGKTYNLQFSYYSDVAPQALAVVDGDTTTYSSTDSGKLTNYSASLIKAVDYSSASSATKVEWHTLKAEITPTAACANPELYFYFAGNITNGSTNQAIVADLSVSEPLPKYNVTATANGNGTASASVATATEGTVVTFTATANDGEQFLGWYNAEGTPVSTNATYTATVGAADLTLTAKFTQNNLLGNLKAADFTHHDQWSNPDKLSDTTITVGDSEVSAIRFGGAQYQVFYFTKELTAGVTYQYSFSVKSACKYHATRIFKASEITTGGNSLTSTSGEYLLNAYLSAGVDASAGIDRTFDTFTPTETDTYAFFIKFAELTDSTAEDVAAYMYNISLVEVVPEYSVAVNTEGNGKATASASTVEKGTEVTFTATTNDSYFLGWYDADDDLVSTKAVYTTAINADTTLTAKFTGTNLLGNLTASDITHQEKWATKEDNVLITVGDETVNAIKVSYLNDQGYYFTCDLTAGKKYTFSFGIKFMFLRITNHFHKFRSFLCRSSGYTFIDILFHKRPFRMIV